MQDIVRCYVDILYLKATLRVPQRAVTGPSEPIASGPPSSPPRHGIVEALRIPAAWLRGHFDRHAAAAALAGKRSLRRIGG
jgi:hypothetical protein